MKNKGFAFTLDAFFAAIIIISIFGAITFLTFGEIGAQKISQKQIAFDLVDIAVDLEIIQTGNQTQIEDFFTNNLPGQFDYQLLVEEYNYNGSFSLNQSRTYGNIQDLNSINYVEAKEVFLEYSGTAITKYNTAKFRVWLK